MNTTPPHAHRPIPEDVSAAVSPLVERPVNDMLLAAATNLMLAIAASPRDRVALVDRARSELESLAVQLGAH